MAILASGADTKSLSDKHIQSAFVFVTMKMEAAFNAMFFSMLNWICIDSACNVNLMNFLPEGITDYVLIMQG